MAVAEVLMQEFIGWFEVPHSIHSDQGQEFESQLIAKLCRLIHMKKNRTTPYNPKSDGMVERMNWTVKLMLSSLVNETQNNWDCHLSYVMMVYEASKHESSKCTPNLLILNHETNLPIDLMVGRPPSRAACPHAYVEWDWKATEFAFEFVQKQLKTSAVSQKTLYDRNSRTSKYEIGSTVWRCYPPQAKRKFGKGWTGSYLVIGKVCEWCCILRKTQQANTLVVHVDNLKEYQGLKPIQRWLTAGNDGMEALGSHCFWTRQLRRIWGFFLLLCCTSRDGPPEQGHEENLDGSFLDQAGELEMTLLPTPLLPVLSNNHPVEDIVGRSGPLDQTEEVRGAPALLTSPLLDPGVLLGMSSQYPWWGAPGNTWWNLGQVWSRQIVSQKDQICIIKVFNLNLPLALRRQRRPKKSKYILDLSRTWQSLVHVFFPLITDGGGNQGYRGRWRRVQAIQDPLSSKGLCLHQYQSSAGGSLAIYAWQPSGPLPVSHPEMSDSSEGGTPSGGTLEEASSPQ